MTTSETRGAREPMALLIDYGGVLTASVLEAFSAACTSIGVDSQGFLNEAFAASHAKDSPFALLELGHIGGEEFSERLTPVLRRYATGPVNGHQFFSAVQNVTWDVDAAMTAAVNGFIAAGVPTVLVSNSWGKSETYPWEQLPAFTAAVVSSEVGLRKPDRDIYLLAAERVDVEPAQCVFVDDLEVNLATARELGMTAVLHKAAETTIAELARLLGVTGDSP
ncbi:HAD family hydrolase [Mycobacterium sp.]|uniref:HAD family hydrolase n=1 Tax=Mycobacterium sp. TaxID=1785 RepID=UPI003F9617DD